VVRRHGRGTHIDDYLFKRVEVRTVSLLSK
jgi:hypothetical protein